MNKKAILVVGAESTGNRLMARLLIAAGCYGDGDVFQRLDKMLTNPLPEDMPFYPIVWIRSFPHGAEGDGRHWPDLAWLRYRLSLNNYHEVHVIVMLRDLFAATQSQVTNNHVETIEQARVNFGEAYVRIFNQIILTKLPFTPVNYESLVKHKLKTMRWILSRLDLPRLTELPEKLTDENEKWYRGEMNNEAAH